jgi:hypothetical protein
VSDKPRVTVRGVTGKVLLRVVASMVVGAALILMWVGAYRSGWLNSALNETDLGQFILLLVVGLPIALLVSALLAGPLLWLMRARPVWPIVLIGPVVLGLAHYFKVNDQAREMFPDKWTAEVLLAAASYGIAGLSTAPAIWRKRS